MRVKAAFRPWCVHADRHLGRPRKTLNDATLPLTQCSTTCIPAKSRTGLDLCASANRGLDDLAAGIVRTPLEPAETFTDDPLRILRCVRFASRYGYTIHQSIVECLTLDGEVRGELREGLTRKVSRERFGIEVDKMLQGPDPLRALQLLSQLDLYSIVFSPLPPENQRMQTAAGENVSTELDDTIALSAGTILADILDNNSGLAQRIPADWREALATNFEDVRRYLWFSVALVPLRGVYIPQNKTTTWAGAVTISSGLKVRQC